MSMRAPWMRGAPTMSVLMSLCSASSSPASIQGRAADAARDFAAAIAVAEEAQRLVRARSLRRDLQRAGGGD
jgi:hypothetical protein